MFILFFTVVLVFYQIIINKNKTLFFKMSFGTCLHDKYVTRYFHKYIQPVFRKV